MNRKMAFLIFFSIVISIYALINYYIYVRGLQAIPPGHSIRAWYPWVFLFIASTYVAGRFMEKVYLGGVSDILVWTGSFWLAAMIYFLLLVLFADLLRLINHFLPFYPAWLRINYAQAKFIILGVSVVLVAGIVLGGFINARNPRITTLEIHIPKPAGGMDRLEAVVMSDIHLGTLIGNGFLRRIVNTVNDLSPDIILLPGDILDEDLQPVLRQNTGETLKQLKAPLGVYGIMGNHEHIGGAAPAYEYLSSHGIQMLRDSVVKINGAIYLVGREDRDKPRFTGKPRLSLEELLQDVDFDAPVILLDHQPFYLEKAAALGIDLQLSGHTHHGQLWPLNYITRAMYTISKGYEKIEGMHAYVSSGVGTWGPPVRTGSRPEILHLVIRFSEAP
jgi:uncharacterized protein